MAKLTQHSVDQLSSSRLRRQPLYAATRLRCAVAMLVLAFAVMLCALPSLANSQDCEASATTQPAAMVELWAAPAGC